MSEFSSGVVGGFLITLCLVLCVVAYVTADPDWSLELPDGAVLIKITPPAAEPYPL